MGIDKDTEKYLKNLKPEGGYAQRPPRAGAKKVSKKAWKKLQKSVYGIIDKTDYHWIKTEGQYTSLRDIFNIPVHIPNIQIKNWIKEFREKNGG